MPVRTLVADTFAGGVIMIFNLALATRFSIGQSRQTSELASATYDSRQLAYVRQNQNSQRTPAGSGLFGVLVSNSAPQGRWF
jgi:hypothetical protein